MKQIGSMIVALALAAVPILATVEAANAESDPRAGEPVYNQTCIACHGADGKGEIPGTPDLSRMDGVLTQSDEVLLNHLLNGFQSNGSPMAMPAKGGNDDLSTADLRNVLRYLHEKFHYKTYN